MALSKEAAERLLEQAYKKVSSKPFVGFKVKAAKTGLFDCKIGGMPYFPKNAEYPVCRSKANDGKPLWLLAQLNFEKIPHIQGFPEKGILQFFTGGDDCYGMNFDDLTAQEDFRIIYHENIIADESRLMSADDLPDFSGYGDFPEVPFDPGKEEYLLEPAEKSEVHPDFSTVNFCDAFMEIYREEYPDDDAEDPYDIEIDDEEDMTVCELADLMSGNDFETFIGGYPLFTQDDPRDGIVENGEKYDTVLFESMSIYDEENNVNIMWGDMGTGSFLISHEKLEQCDFSDVIYNYDCY